MSQTNIFGITEGGEMPPPGHRVDVGWHKLHLWCTGLNSGPTVILEAGMLNYSLAWSLIQPEVAKFARVCSYDRAGLGWSDQGLPSRSVDAIVEELHALLLTGGVPTPYLLVGHSMGGVYVREYANRYPAEVAGVILADSAHEQQEIRLPAERQKVLNAGRASSVELFQKYAKMSHGEITREVLSGRQTNTASRFPPEIDALFIDRLRPGIFQTMAEELLSGVPILSQSNYHLGSLGTIPLSVLTAGARVQYAGVSDELHKEGERIWFELQRELASISSNSTHHIIEDSSHDMPMEKPQVIIDAIQNMLLTAN